MADPRIAEKRAVARAAAAQIPDGARLGLGSGTTAEAFVREVGRRVGQGLRVEAVATSSRTHALARGLGIRLVDLDERPLDVAVDGADEVDNALRLLKGRGGALVRERIVAASARRLWILADEAKLVRRLGEHGPLTLEIQPFGWRATLARLRAILPGARLRERGGRPAKSDGGGLLLDAPLPARLPLEQLDARLRAVAGVVDVGLFLGFPVELVTPGAAPAPPLTE